MLQPDRTMTVNGDTISAEPIVLSNSYKFLSCDIWFPTYIEALEELDNSKESINEEKREAKKRRFAEPVTEQDIEERKRSVIPKKTREGTKYCAKNI